MIDTRTEFIEWRLAKVEERERAVNRREADVKIREAVARKKEEHLQAWESKLKKLQQQLDLTPSSDSDLPEYSQLHPAHVDFDGESVPPPQKAVITSIQLQPSGKPSRGVIDVKPVRKQVTPIKQQNGTRKRKSEADGVVIEHKRVRKVIYAEAEDDDFCSSSSPVQAQSPRKSKKSIKKDENGWPKKANLESVHALTPVNRTPTAREISRAQNEHVKRVNGCIEFMLAEIALLKDMQHFATLPDEDEDEDHSASYYSVVKRPIALAHIQEKRESYTDVLDFTRDVLRIPFNARRFYQSEHPHSTAASRLETQICDIINRAQVSFGEDLWVFETPDPLEVEAASSLAALADLAISTSQTESESDATEDDARKVSLPSMKAIYHRKNDPSPSPVANKDCITPRQMDVGAPKRETTFPIFARAG